MNKDTEKCKRYDKLKKETVLVSKNDFVPFMADIINCSAQSSSRNERIKIIVKSAEKYLDVKELSCEDVENILIEDAQPSQTWTVSS